MTLTLSLTNIDAAMLIAEAAIRCRPHLAHWFETGSRISNSISLLHVNWSSNWRQKCLRYPRAIDLLRGLLLLSDYTHGSLMAEIDGSKCVKRPFRSHAPRKHFLASGYMNCKRPTRAHIASQGYKLLMTILSSIQYNPHWYWIQSVTHLF